MKESKYRILIDYGIYEGMKLWDENGFDTLNAAVKEAVTNSFSSPFLIIKVIDWSAIEAGCPYSDCPKVKYKECPIHGEKTEKGERNSFELT